MKQVIYDGEISIPDTATRTVELKIEHDSSKPIWAELYQVDPGSEHKCRSIGDVIKFNVPKRSVSSGMYRALSYKVKFFQHIQQVKSAEPEKEKFELQGLNPVVEEVEKKEGPIMTAVKNNKYSQKAILKAKERKEAFLKKQQEQIEARALKPLGLDGRRILTCDDVGYTKTTGIIQYLLILEKELNKNANSETEYKLINEFYDCFAFSGMSSIAKLYLALGKKSVGNGSIEYLLKWWMNEFRFAFSPTSFQNVKSKFKMMARGKQEEGLLESNARRCFEKLFMNPNTGKQYKMDDLNVEVYLPILFDDFRSRAYTKIETPNAKLVDVAVACGLDPCKFNVKKFEEDGQSIGSFIRSYDLPIAQNNNGIHITSIGVPLRFKDLKTKFENLSNEAKSIVKIEGKNFHEYKITMRHMQTHQSEVDYKRFETAPMDDFGDSSVNSKNLNYAIACAEKGTIITNGTIEQKLLN